LSPARSNPGVTGTKNVSHSGPCKRSARRNVGPVVVRLRRAIGTPFNHTAMPSL
jgi:hypothetical protein